MINTYPSDELMELFFPPILLTMAIKKTLFFPLLVLLIYTKTLYNIY